MNFAVYMKNKTGTPYNVMLGVFLMEEDASRFFDKKNTLEGDDYSFHMCKIDCWGAWTEMRKELV